MPARNKLKKLHKDSKASSELRRGTEWDLPNRVNPHDPSQLFFDFVAGLTTPQTPDDARDHNKEYWEQFTDLGDKLRTTIYQHFGSTTTWPGGNSGPGGGPRTRREVAAGTSGPSAGGYHIFEWRIRLAGPEDEGSAAACGCGCGCGCGG